MGRQNQAGGLLQFTVVSMYQEGVDYCLVNDSE